MREPTRNVSVRLATYQKLLRYLTTIRPRPPIVEIMDMAVDQWIERQAKK